MPYGPCVFCDSVTAYDFGDPICGTCDLMMSDASQRDRLYQQFESDRERRHMENLMREENEQWESDADRGEADLLREEVRQQMEEDDQRLYRDRLRGNSNDELFRSIYFNHDTYITDEDEDEEQRENEEELYQDDQDDFGIGTSYQEGIQAIRDELSTRRFDLALDRAAIVQRLLRIFVSGEGLEDDDASQAKGATEADIATLKTRSLEFDDLERSAECAICTEVFESQELTKLPCSHEYHSECIHHWLKLNASCPMCRQTVFTSKTVTEQQESEEENVAIEEQQQERVEQVEEPDIIIIRRETADLLRQNNSPLSYMDDVD